MRGRTAVEPAATVPVTGGGGGGAEAAPDLEAGRRTRTRQDALAGWGFIAPFLAIYLVLLLWPVVQALYMSGFTWDLLTLERAFLGIDNYRQMLWGTEMGWSPTHLVGLRVAILVAVAWYWRRSTRAGGDRRAAWWLVAVVGVGFAVVLLGVRPDPVNGRWFDAVFWRSFRNTLLFVVLSTPLTVAVGLGLALLLGGTSRLANVFRAVFFCSYVFPVAVVTLMWGFLLNPQQGLIGAAFQAVGLEPIAFLTSPTLALPAIVVTTMWWTVGFNMVLFIAGMQDIEPDLYEAAELDGAGWWARFQHITVPGLKRTFLLVTVLQVIASFQIFGQVYIMTRGGPAGSTRVLVQHIYETGFRDFDLGYASAISVFLFVVMLVVSVLQFRLLGEEDEA
jgi:multiple sugar transport system permease protein